MDTHLEAAWSLSRRSLDQAILHSTAPTHSCRSSRVEVLELERVLIVNANERVLPLPYAVRGLTDHTDLEAQETKEGSLAYVASSHWARQGLAVLNYGTPSCIQRPEESGPGNGPWDVDPHSRTRLSCGPGMA